MYLHFLIDQRSDASKYPTSSIGEVKLPMVDTRSVTRASLKRLKELYVWSVKNGEAWHTLTYLRTASILSCHEQTILITKKPLIHKKARYLRTVGARICISHLSSQKNIILCFVPKSANRLYTESLYSCPERTIFLEYRRVTRTNIRSHQLVEWSFTWLTSGKLHV